MTDNKIAIYTDGGCTGNPGPGGWGVVLLVDGQNVELSGGDEETTNNRMEMTAAIEALVYLKNNGLSTKTVDLYTDSEYLKNGITGWIHNWKRNGWKTASRKPVKNKDLWMELDKQLLNCNINWHWVKGHSGNEWNERCDSLVAMEREKLN